jgi:hypothetical protein
MSGPSSSRNWAATLAWAVLLLVIGAALAAWGLSRWDEAARVLGVAPQPQLQFRPEPQALRPAVTLADAPTAARLQALESRMAAVEATSRQAAGSVGRADALLVAFAARRAVDRGVPLGYLEALLDERFGAQHQRAVAVIISGARQPVTLEQLRERYARLEKDLAKGGADEGLWSGLKRELASLVSIRRASTPSPQPQARYDRAAMHLDQGQVDAALAETMRMPGAARAGPWIAEARRYVTVHRALDEVESSALLAGSR